MNQLARANSKLLGLTLFLALLSALATAGALQAKHPFFVVPQEYDIGMGASNEARMALLNQTQIVDRKNAMLFLAIGGALLGTSLALVANACCSLPVRVASGLGWGATWGMITGLLSSQALLLIIPRGTLASVTTTGLSQAVAFGVLGAGLGLMYGGFAKNAKAIASSALTGMVAGTAGGFAFAMIVGFVAQAQNNAQLIPTGAVAQSLWLGIPFLAIAFGLMKAAENMQPAASEVVHSEKL